MDFYVSLIHSNIMPTDQNCSVLDMLGFVFQVIGGLISAKAAHQHEDFSS